MAWAFRKSITWAGSPVQAGDPVPDIDKMRPGKIENLRRCNLIVKVPDLVVEVAAGDPTAAGLGGNNADTANGVEAGTVSPVAHHGRRKGKGKNKRK